MQQEVNLDIPGFRRQGPGEHTVVHQVEFCQSHFRAGARLIGATVNGTGSLLMRAERVGADTLLSQIVHMVSEAQRSRAPIQRVADAAAGYFVPLVVTAAVVTAIAWALDSPARSAQ